MSKASLDIQSGFIPYSDGSGFKASVTLRDANDGLGPQLSIDVGSLDVADWPKVRDGIERLLRILDPVGGARD